MESGREFDVEIYVLDEEVGMAQALLGRAGAIVGQSIPAVFEPVEPGIGMAVIQAGAVAKLIPRNPQPSHFVLARVKYFVPRDMVRETGNPFVVVTDHPSYPEGLYLSTYNHQDVKHHLKTRTLAEKLGWYHIQMRDMGNPAVNALRAYGAEVRTKTSGRYPPLVVCRTVRPTESDFQKPTD